MTGMKEGAGEDPFAEEENTEVEEQSVRETQDSDPKAEIDGASKEEPTQTMQIPYIFRRDGVQDGRDRVPLFIQEDTKSAERDALRDLEERFEDDIQLTDLREALVKTGLNNIDEVAGHLEDWGYGMTFDE